MKTIKLSIFILLSGLLFSGVLYSCNKKTTQTDEITDSIPENAVPFEYTYKKGILISGTLNDSIHCRYLLETGAMGVVFSDSLYNGSDNIKTEPKSDLILQPMKVKIGQWEKIYNDSAYLIDKNHPAFKWFGKDVAWLPWRFFDKKIIEINFSKKYIRELTNTDNLQNYDSVKMEIENGFLGIPVVVSVQGKKIKELLIFDTGNNGNIFFINKIRPKYDIKAERVISRYNIVTDSIYIENNVKKKVKNGLWIAVDSIQIGKYFVPGEHWASFRLNLRGRPMPFSGVIGTGVLDDLDLVLDLKNYYLYLKPNK